MGRSLGTDPITGDTTPHVLWKDRLINPGQECAPLNITVDDVQSDSHSAEGDHVDSKGEELMSRRMWLTRFYVQATSTNSKVYDVSVAMAYGDSDLITWNASGHPNCSGGKGTQYCATASISTTASQRATKG
jgi:hypothetical protein